MAEVADHEGGISLINDENEDANSFVSIRLGTPVEVMLRVVMSLPTIMMPPPLRPEPTPVPEPEPSGLGREFNFGSTVKLK